MFCQGHSHISLSVLFTHLPEMVVSPGDSVRGRHPLHLPPHQEWALLTVSILIAYPSQTFSNVLFIHAIRGVARHSDRISVCMPRYVRSHFLWHVMLLPPSQRGSRHAIGVATSADSLHPSGRKTTRARCALDGLCGLIASRLIEGT